MGPHSSHLLSLDVRTEERVERKKYAITSHGG